MTASTLALHRRIRDDIETRIRRGDLKPGERIPYEYELIEDYGCARATVNKALSALADDGLIERRKRAGSFVRAQRLDAAVLDIPDIESEVKARGDAYLFRLLTRSIHPAAQEAERELAGEGQVLALTGIHFSGGQPLAYEDRLINLAAVPQAEGADFTAQSPGHWLLEAVPWSRASSEISAVATPVPIAKATGWPRDTVCLVVSRRTWRGEDRVTSVRQVFDAGRYRLTADFNKRT